MVNRVIIILSTVIFLFSIPQSIEAKNNTCKSTDTISSKKYEAEKANYNRGTETENCSEGGKNVGYINNNDYIGFKNVDLNNLKQLKVRVASDKNAKLEMRLDNPNGKLISTLNVSNTGGWQNWKTLNANVKTTNGIKNIYFVFKGSNDYLMNINWI